MTYSPIALPFSFSPSPCQHRPFEISSSVLATLTPESFLWWGIVSPPNEWGIRQADIFGSKDTMRGLPCVQLIPSIVVMAKDIGGIPIIFGDPRQPKSLPNTHAKAKWNGFRTEMKVLPKGYVQRTGCLPLPCDILYERDQPVELRDGTAIYADIFRPANAETQVPAIVSWSPYGKSPGGGVRTLHEFPFRLGVPLSTLSELQKWEALDPAYWVDSGYAVIQPDPRGVGMSEGDIYALGSQEAEDCCDLIEYIGQRPWCTGRVGMGGNSYLSMVQWLVAARRPKYLEAIAPWEGASDLFREVIYRGGVESKAALTFMLELLSINPGCNSWENVVQMALENKLYGPYHADKAAKIEDIQVPAYVVASYSNPIHVYGTWRSFARLTSPKWLRVHDSLHWPDFYKPENTVDMHRFFDRYLKNVQNDWETTPKIRAAIIDTAKPVTGYNCEVRTTSWPPTSNRSIKLFLDGRCAQLKEGFPCYSTSSYSIPQGEVSFTHKFDRKTILFGPLEIQLVLSLSNASDADIFVYAEKVLTGGSQAGAQLVVPFEQSWQTLLLRSVNYLNISSAAKVMFYRGPNGRVRASRRHLSMTEVIPGMPVPDMTCEPQEVKEGETVVVKPAMFPIGMIFQKNESLRIRISCREEGELPTTFESALDLRGYTNINQEGILTLHCGHCDSGMDSWIRLPVFTSCTNTE